MSQLSIALQKYYKYFQPPNILTIKFHSGTKLTDYVEIKQDDFTLKMITEILSYFLSTLPKTGVPEVLELMQIHKKKEKRLLLFLSCGGPIRTNDLWVMSPTSYHCSTPRCFLDFECKGTAFICKTKYFPNNFSLNKSVQCIIG